MAAWDNVQLPSAPAAPSYAAPLLNFAPIGNLAQDYFQGTQNRRTLNLQGAFKEGLPKLPDGSIDITAMTDKLARLGGAEAAQPLMDLQIQQQIGQGNAGVIRGGGQSAAAPAGYSTTTTRPPVPAHGIPSPAPPPGVQTTGEPTQPDTLANVVQSQIEDPVLAGKVMTALAARLGIDPGQKIDPNNPTVKNYIATAKGDRAPQPQQQPQPTFAQRADQAFSPYQNGGAPLTPSVADLEARAREFEQSAKDATARAVAIGGFKGQGPNVAAFESHAKSMMEQAKILREQIAKQQELTTTQKDLYSGAGRLTEQQKLDVKQFGEQYQGIQSAGVSAQNQLPQIQLAQGVLNHPDFVSGAGNDIVLGFRKILAQIDPAHANDALPQEAFRKVMAANVLEQVNQLKAEGQAAGMSSTRLFQSQILLMEKAAQNPTNTVASNRLLTEIASRHAQLQMKIAGMADDYKQAHGGLDANWNKQLRQYLTAHQMFTPAEMADPRLIAPPVFRNPAQVAAARLPPDTPIKIMRPNGSMEIRYVPKPGQVQPQLPGQASGQPY